MNPAWLYTMMRAVFLLQMVGIVLQVSAFRIRRMERVCKATASIKNGNDLKLKYQQWDRQYEISTVSCKEGYQMNIKSNNIWFRCTEGVWEGMNLNQRIQDFTLNNVTCKKRNPCTTRPQYIVNGGFRVIERYCLPLKGVHRCSRTFYSGDKIKYKCYKGYKALPYKTIVTVDDDDNDEGTYYYFDIYDEEEEEEEEKQVEVYESRNMQFECDQQGQWRNGQDDQFPVCEEIVCNASRFENISDGYIKNFTTIYKYGEILELVCDRGFRPIGGLRLIQCIDPEQLDTIEFGCRKTKCPEPVPPLEGGVRLINRTRYVDDIVYFYCNDYNSKIIGPQNMTCLENGEWSSDHCVRCIPEDADCPPPCMHAGNELLTSDPEYIHGSVLQLTCENNPDMVVNRTCLINNRWDKSDLFCAGRKNPLKALMVADSLRATMRSLENRTTNGSELEVLGKTINVGTSGGVDIYFALDVSGSIDLEEFNMLKTFTLELIKNLNVSDGPDGTRIAIYVFANHFKLMWDGHQTNPSDIFPDTEEALLEVDAILNWDDIQDASNNAGMKIGQGTNIKAVVKEISDTYDTKRRMPEIGVLGQQVVILISDGELNTGGDPGEDADKLKDMDIHIYSIYVGRRKDGDSDVVAEEGKETMRLLASNIPGEDHYFEIEVDDFMDVIEKMVNRSSPLPCGVGDPERTNVDNITQVQRKIPAHKHAWPWMVQMKMDVNTQAYCGGSVIDKKHVLTAAHCFYNQRQELPGPFTLYFKSHRHHEQSDDSVEEIEVWKGSVTIHPKFNKAVTPKMLYDIAVITLDEPLEFGQALRSVCLPENENLWDNIRPKQQYGIITGWGTDKKDRLHQAQIQIQDDQTCLESIPVGKKKQFNSTLMFCAGGRDGDAVVDTCEGDSGGPFIIEDDSKEDTFIQIGIVSFSIGDCKVKDRYGFYTKLNNELVTWIKEVIELEDEAE